MYKEQKDYIKVTTINCFLGPKESILIPYSQEYLNNLITPPRGTSYRIVEVYKNDVLIEKIEVDLFGSGV